MLLHSIFHAVSRHPNKIEIGAVFDSVERFIFDPIDRTILLTGTNLEQL